MGPEEGNMRVEEKGHICGLELVTNILYVTEHVGHFLSLSFFFEGWGAGGSVALSIRSCIARLHPTGMKYLEKFSCSAVIVRAFNTLFAPPCVEAPLVTLIWPRLWLISLEEWFKAVKVLSRIKSFVAALERQIQKSHSRLSHDFVVE